MTPLKSFLQGLAGTRQQVTYALVGSYIAVLLRGLSMVRTVHEAAELMDAMEVVVMAAMVYWFGGKWLEGKANGSGASAGDQGSAAAAAKVGSAPGAAAPRP